MDISHLNAVSYKIIGGPDSEPPQHWAFWIGQSVNGQGCWECSACGATQFMEMLSPTHTPKSCPSCKVSFTFMQTSLIARFRSQGEH